MQTKKNLGRLGEPCWTTEAISKALSGIAQVHQSRAHYFLASHAPIRQIYNDKSKASITEEGFFLDLFSEGYGDILALVHGDPGTGKSHLIHWLKLRTDDARRSEEFSNVQPVLIQRRSGSLKDALEQVIHQLPKTFAIYLEPIRQALDRISDATRKEMLANEFRLELGERRRDRGRPPLPSEFRYLSETCASPGFREWLLRDGGPADLIIRRLVDSSSVDDRQGLPKFMAADFSVGDRYRNNNAPVVLELIDEFEEYPELRQQAADCFNEVISDAVKEMTGLGSARLRELFDRIRADLKSEGKILALFVEDVSVMSGLDEEVVNALEPQTNDALCRMVAVVGMTETGYQKLPLNLSQRATHSVSLSADIVGRWRNDTEEVARFAARYLNTVRLDEADVVEISSTRRQGGDIPFSACDGCAVKETCHETFGFATIDSVRVGLFPFTTAAPGRLLNSLEESAMARKNPRGLVAHVLLPVLKDAEALELGRFPSGDLGVRSNELPYWAAVENGYCGGWNTGDKKRLRLLAHSWISATSAEEMARKLEPLLAPLSLPKFAKAIRPEPPGKGGPGGQQPPIENTPADGDSLQKALVNLRRWEDGEKYQGDQVPRELIFEFLKNSIDWVNSVDPPYGVVSGYLKQQTKIIQIEDMRSSLHQTKLVLRFPRDPETRALIEALLQFRFAGGKSWRFEHGELHKRVAHRWLRSNEARIRQAFEPGDGVDTSAAIDTATQFLGLAAVLRSRSKLPPALEEVVPLLLSDGQGSTPAALSDKLNRILKDMSVRHRQVREFLFDELNIPQGRTGGINVIDPDPILRAIIEFQKNPRVAPLSDRYAIGFWESRYKSLDGLEAYGNLVETLESESTSLDNLVTELRLIVREAGVESESLADGLVEYAKGVLSLVAQKRASRFVVPDPEFDALVSAGVYRDRPARWATAAEKSEALLKEESPYGVLYFDPSPLLEAKSALVVAQNHAKRVERDVREQEAHLITEGDPREFLSSILKSLSDIDKIHGGVETEMEVRG